MEIDQLTLVIRVIAYFQLVYNNVLRGTIIHRFNDTQSDEMQNNIYTFYQALKPC